MAFFKPLLLSIIPIAITLAISPASAQQDVTDTSVIHKIRAAETKNSHIPELAFHLTDGSGSRLTSSPGFYRAGNYAIATMKSWGLTNVAYEPWGEYGRGWEPQTFSITMQLPYQAAIIGYPQPWSANTKGTITAPVYRLLYTELKDPSYLQKNKKTLAVKSSCLPTLKCSMIRITCSPFRGG